MWWQDSCIFINTRMRPWFTKPGLPRRAGVSSFGFGGANYHCVLEEHEPEHQDAPYRLHQMPAPLLFSAANTAALASLCDQLISKVR